MNEKACISVCIPAYNASKTIKQTIDSVLAQTLKNFELVITDDSSKDDTVDIIKSIKDRRIKLFTNKIQLGAGRNFEKCKNRAKTEIIFYLACDDLLDIKALEKVHKAFSISPDIGIVTRPYFWFQGKSLKPVRATKQFLKDKIVSMESPLNDIRDVIALSDQVSGMGFRKSFLKDKFSNEPFIEISSIVLPMLKKCKAVILKDNIIAVRVDQSGSMNPNVYFKSPIMAWYNLINNTYKSNNFRNLREYLIRNFVANNYVGLVQIKNYGPYKSLLREIYYLLRLKKSNVVSLRFWVYSLLTILTPRSLLRKLTRYYKNNINSMFIRNIAFEHSIKNITS